MKRKMKETECFAGTWVSMLKLKPTGMDFRNKNSNPKLFMRRNHNTIPLFNST
jgi:hypothetical protein